MIDLNALAKYTEKTKEDFLKNYFCNSLYLFGGLMPDYENAYEIPLGTFTAPEDGFISLYAHGQNNNNGLSDACVGIGIREIIFTNRSRADMGANAYATVFAPIPKDETATISVGQFSDYKCHFIPLKK